MIQLLFSENLTLLATSFILRGKRGMDLPVRLVNIWRFWRGFFSFTSGSLC